MTDKVWPRGQAVKTSPFHGGNTGSIPVGVIYADVAQLAEQLICNQQVIGSSPIIGLVHLLKKESLTRGIHVNISDDNHISIDFHIIVAYGVSISAVTDNLISDVKYRVEEFSGMQVDKINVYIEGVRVID